MYVCTQKGGLELLCMSAYHVRDTASKVLSDSNPFFESFSLIAEYFYHHCGDDVGDPGWSVVRYPEHDFVGCHPLVCMLLAP